MAGGTYKRKSAPSEAASVLAVYRPYKSPYKRRKTFVPGRDRVGGFYGRYAGRNAELKFHDVDLDDAVVAQAGGLTATINIIAQGTTESERIGRKCTIRQVHWRYRLALPTQDAIATPASSDTCRVILYQDKQCNGATAAITDVLESADIHSFRNLANSGRFVILMDKMHTLTYQGLSSDAANVMNQGQVVREFTYNKTCSIPIEYNSTVGVITEIRSNNLGVLLISSSGVIGLNSKFRLRYSDM